MKSVVILAAGAGSRFKSDIPKSLYKFVNNKSSLEMLLDYIEEIEGISDIHIVLGYKINEYLNVLCNYLNTNKKAINIYYNPDYNNPNNCLSFIKASSGLRDLSNTNDVIMIDADTIIRNNVIFESIINTIAFIDSSAIITCDKFNSNSEWVINSDFYTLNVTNILDNTDNKTEHISSGIVHLKHSDFLLIDNYVRSNISNYKYWDDAYKYHFKEIFMKEIYIPGYYLIDEIDDIDNVDIINSAMFGG